MKALEIIQSFERHVRSEVAMGINSVDHACEKIMPVLTLRLRQLEDVPMEDATAANEHLSTDGNTFNFDQRKELSMLVKSRMQSDTAEPKSKQTNVMQKHMYLHHYYPAKLWAIAESAETLTNIFKMFASFYCQNLGLRHPDAQTKKLAVVSILIAKKIEASPMDVYRYIQEFGEIMDVKRTSIATKSALATYPRDPQDFIHRYPSSYGTEDPPVTCRISEAELLEKCRPENAPCRNTNAKVGRASSSASIQPSPHVQAPPAGDQGVQQLLVGLLSSFMHDRDRNNNRPPQELSDYYERSRQRSPPALRDREPPTQHTSDSQSPLQGDPDSIVSGGVGATVWRPVESPAQSAHDKLAALAADINASRSSARGNEGGNAGEHADDADAAVPPSAPTTAVTHKKPASETSDAMHPRLWKKTKPPGNSSGKNTAKSNSATPKSMKKSPPAKAAPSSSHGEAKPLRQRKATLERYAKLLAAKPKSKRPKFAQAPTKHHGGKIYWQGAKNTYRIYKRIGDTLDTKVLVDPTIDDDAKKKFTIACSIIEEDGRPIDTD